jgi:hypothetical protein
MVSAAGVKRYGGGRGVNATEFRKHYRVQSYQSCEECLFYHCGHCHHPDLDRDAVIPVRYKMMCAGWMKGAE